jgi:hypothetical protein
MAVEAHAIRVIDEWCDGLDLYQDKLPSKGSIAAALHVLSRLRSAFELTVSAHVSGGESQITGLSAAAVKRILAEFGETRILSAVGGRSNRGGRGDIARLLDAMRPLHLEELPPSKREDVLRSMQQHLVLQYVARYFAVKRVKAAFDQNAATWRFIEMVLENAKASGKAGAVAEYLIGAKLSVKFPGIVIRNKRFSIADAPTHASGDFEVGNTVFHVTVAPMIELLEKIRTNLERGLRVYLLVRELQVLGARELTEGIAAGRITVQSIESFVATNIDEAAEFHGNAKLKSGLRRLLEKYNERVDEAELDKSMLIELPSNLN